jgi:hypothetical protein
MHLFFECEFSQSFWWALNLEWDTNMSLYEMLTDGNQMQNYIHISL